MNRPFFLKATQTGDTEKSLSKSNNNNNNNNNNSIINSPQNSQKELTDVVCF
jgi:hypothetical protein